MTAPRARAERERTTGETALAEARRIANYLLDQLPEEMRRSYTSRAQSAGIRWLGSQVVVYAEDRAIPTDLAAELVGVSKDTIRQWACTPHPEDPTRMLLPRNVRRGRSMTYLVSDIKAAAWLASTTHLSRRVTRPAA